MRHMAPAHAMSDTLRTPRGETTASDHGIRSITHLHAWQPCIDAVLLRSPGMGGGDELAYDVHHGVRIQCDHSAISLTRTTATASVYCLALCSVSCECGW